MTKTYRISDAARAIGVPRFTIQKWFSRGLVDPITDQPPGRWDSFRAADIAHFAVVAQLIGHGVGVLGANMISENLSDEMGKKASPAKIKNFWHKKLVFVYQNEQGWAWTISEDKVADLPAHIVLDVQRTVSNAFDRLDEISNED